MSTENRAPTSGLPRRFLRPLLLLSLSRVGRSHGYELAESVRGFGLNVDMAGVYRELRSMEQRDILNSEWEPSQDGPERRVYGLTAEGMVAAKAATDELTMARDLLAAALAAGDGAASVNRSSRNPRNDLQNEFQNEFQNELLR